MFSPPSLLREYALISRFDPALDKPVPPPECEPLTDESPEDFEARQKARAEAIGKADAEWTRRFAVARDAGTWRELIKAGHEPTVFHVRQIPGAAWYRLLDYCNNERNGVGQFGQLALVLRAGVVRIDGYAPGHKLERAEHVDVNGNRTGLGELLTEDAISLLHSAHPLLVPEIGTAILERRMAPPGK
jgi:hypothetical protein